ncbi:XRE family transcriptional regulator [Streptomyces sp. AP-93]|uniref:XRE family transcriptional regulator n=1 Tax=Streptomyces sp. AP-93 TaxID=2929048 RepID=UPI001FAFBA31|nr:XRE family transcriptional regulator [Streptomyces sp. AP-93]MCJ0873488.1 XRE family transcriptional regulator [Streptomyces sp. AP-93]
MTAPESSAALPPELLHHAEIQAAIACHDFGSVFRIARDLAGISYSKIAAACDMKPERVGLLARGEGSVTTFEKIAAISDGLRIPGHLLGLAPRWREAHQPLSAAALAMGPVGSGEESVERRDFFKTTVLTGLAVALPDLQPIAGRGRVSSALPEQLRERTARLRRLDNILGGGDTFRVYVGEYQATKGLIREASYTEPTGRALLSVLAEQAQQAGWAAFDCGKQSEATNLYEISHQAATEAGDGPLAGNALAFLAYQRVNGDRKAGLEIAVRSCQAAGPAAPSSVRALLHERHAWACSLVGDSSATQAALSAAEAALHERDDTPQPDWASWVDRVELMIMTGRCWTELGRPLRAVPVLESALDQFDDNNARDKSLYLTWLAEAYLQGGEIEEAASVVHRSLDLAAGVASVRPRQRIAPALHRLGDHRSAPAVAAVLERSRD